ncbi:MAG TPA: GNAT family N-acetyltransferase [Pedobacter sp.]|jgi:ribosomal protein S18 acetylase RimI-like enzyme
MKDFQLLSYKPEYKIHFEKLNKAWLEKYFSVEAIDKWVLENPEEAILKDGGKIFFVSLNDKIIGTVALMKVADQVFELTKMAVDEKYQGIGAGKFICLAAIDEGRKLGASKLNLYSQTNLKPAIGIYKKLGFVEVTIDTKYARADIKMEILLK